MQLQPVWLGCDVSLPRSDEARGEHCKRGVPAGPPCSHHMTAHDQKKTEGRSPLIPPGTFFTAACRWGRVASEKPLVHGRVWMVDPAAAAKAKGGADKKDSTTASGASKNDANKLAPPTVHFEATADDADVSSKLKKPGAGAAKKTSPAKKAAAAAASDNDADAEVLKSFDVVAVVTSPLSDTSALLIGRAESILVVFLTPVLVGHFVAATSHLTQENDVARLWRANLSLGRHFDILTLCTTAKRRFAIEDAQKLVGKLYNVDSSVLVEVPQAARVLREKGERYVHVVVACRGDVGETQKRKSLVKIAAAIKGPSKAAKDTPDGSGSWLALCDRAVIQGAGETIVRQVRYMDIRTIAFVGNAAGGDAALVKLVITTDDAPDGLEFGPIVKTAQKSVEDELRVAFETETSLFYPQQPAGRAGAVPTCNPCPSDATALGWLRYMLAHRMYRVVDLVGKLPQAEWAVVTRSLVRACSAEGLVPQLLAEVMALEIRTVGTIDRFLHEKSVASLTVAHYVGYAVDEWAHAVLMGVVEKLYRNKHKWSMRSAFDRDALCGFVSHIFRVVVVSDSNRTVPPELRAVLGALHYTAEAVGAADGLKLLPLFSTYILTRGINRCLLDPSRFGLKPEPGAIENGKAVARVLRVLGEDRTFDAGSPDEYELVWMHDWLATRKPEMLHIYKSLANPFSLPPGSVARPGQLAVTKKIEAARVDGRLRAQYAAPDGMHRALLPLSVNIQRFAMVMLIDSWAMEDMLVEQLENTRATLDTLRSGML